MTRPKHALVIEGGGMKGAYANGVLTAFERAGYRPFDALYGTSAGGALAAWFSAGQAEYAEATWDYAADRRILSYRRMLLGRGPLLDHEALLDIVYQREHPIDQEAIQRARWPVFVTAVDVGSAELLYHDLRKGPVIDWLKATGRLPFGSGPPVAIGGRLLMDGGMIDPIPVRKAVEDGASEVTVLLNNPPGPRRPENLLVRLVASRRYPALREGVERHHEIKMRAYGYLGHPPDGVRIHLVHPAAPTGIHRLTRDLPALHRVIALGRRDGEAHLRARAA